MEHGVLRLRRVSESAIAGPYVAAWLTEALADRISVRRCCVDEVLLGIHERADDLWPDVARLLAARRLSGWRVDEA